MISKRTRGATGLTNKFATGAAGAALVISVLALFVALSALEEQPAAPEGTAVPSNATTALAAVPTQPTSVVTTSAATAASPVVIAAPDTTAAPTTTIGAPDTTEALPGEPAEFGPEAGTQLGVVGVRHNSDLNVRDVPNGTIVATLNIRNAGQDDQVLQIRDKDTAQVVASLSVDGITATGRSRNLSTSTWHEIQAGPIVGWASSNYLAPLSSDTRLDVTDEVTRKLGTTPTSATLTGLGDMVAAAFKYDEPPSRVAVSGAPSESGGVGKVTIDVLGLPDDSIRGYRLLITAASSGGSSGDDDTEAEAQTFTLQSVFATPLCYSDRGISDDGALPISVTTIGRGVFRRR